MRNIRSLVLLGVFLSIILVLVACSGNSSTKQDDSENGEKTEEKIKIKVGVVNDFPPFEYIEDGEVTGFDVDLLEAIADSENLEVEWDVMKFDGMIPALQGNQIDVAISAITATEERKEVVDFSDKYIVSETVLIVPEDSSIQEVPDIDKKSVAVKQGTTGHLAAKELAEKYDIEIKVFQEDATMYLDVESGNADAAINVNFAAAFKIKQDTESGKDNNLRIIEEGLIESEMISIAVSKDKNEVLERINNGIKNIQEDGTYDKVHDKYFGID